MHLIYSIDGQPAKSTDLVNLYRESDDWDGYETARALQPGEETLFAGKTVRCDFDMTKMVRRVVFTTAPECYDWSFCSIKTLETFECVSLGGSTPKTWRKLDVVGEPYHIESQFARYASGLHPACDTDPREEVRRFHAKLAAEKAERERKEAARANAMEWLRTCSDEALEKALHSGEDEPEGLGYTELQAELRERKERAASDALEARYQDVVKRIPEALVFVATNGERTVHLKVRVNKCNGGLQVSSDLREDLGDPDDIFNWMKKGIALPYDPSNLPPVKVLDRVGRDRLLQIHTFEIEGQKVYVARQVFGYEVEVLGEDGHKVRKKALREEAVNLFQKKIYGY